MRLPDEIATAIGAIGIIFVYTMMVLESKAPPGRPLRIRYGLFAPVAALGLFTIAFGAIMGETPAIFAVLGFLVILDFLSFILGNNTPSHRGIEDTE